MSNIYRDVTLNQVSEQDIGKTIRVAGWVENIRDHGGVSFIDLRDMYAVMQIVIRDGKLLEGIRKEQAITVEGLIEKRDEETYNPKIPTGTIELDAKEVTVLGEVYSQLPFEVMTSKSVVHEDVRLKYRYLDLRNQKVKDNIIFRSKVISYLREKMTSMGFLELQTPILCASSPEGARDYIVPSRKFKGKFYALPQAPQQYKQLLMVSGFDKYFQIAPCFRDEDARAARSPGEFYQLDFEMSFATQEDVFAVGEEVLSSVFEKFAPEGSVVTKAPYPIISYKQAMLEFGSDKPDLRFDMHFYDISDLLRDTGFKVFRNVLDNGGIVKAITVKGDAAIPRRELDGLVDYVGNYGAKGLAWIGLNKDGSLKCQITKFLGEDKIREIGKFCEAENGDLILIIADKPKVVAQALGELRLEMARRMNLIDENEFCFRWVTDFPMFEYSEEDKRWVAEHHPFTAPRDEDVQYLLTDPSKVYAKAYDMVLNGVEAGGGSLRIYQEELQEKVFKAIGITHEEAQEKFGFLLDAFRYGAPPHAGIALGLDRLVMLMLRLGSIRDVIAFPKTQSAIDQMTQAPSEVVDMQLKELHIRVDVKKEKNLLI